MISVDEAHARIVARFRPLPAEWVMLALGRDRVLADDLAAPRDQPPRAVSAMDGYAVRAADLAAGAAELEVIGEVPAGRAFEGRVGPGEAARIFTGAPLPDGADAVAIQENARPAAGRRVLIEGALEPGRFVRPAGLDFRAGEVVLPAGHRLGARDLGLAAAMGRVWLPVRRRPRIGLLATGDELVLPGEAAAPHQIVSSNTVALAAMLEVWGAVPLDLGIVRDEPAAFAAAAPRLAGVDLLVTLGGASVGDRDLVRAALGAEGLELDFWKIAMRPGKPLLFGTFQGTPLLGLPGNPVSAGVCAVLFIRGVVAAMLGRDPAPPYQPAVLAHDLPANDEREEFLRAGAARDADGRLLVTPATRQDSSMFRTFALAGCLIRRPAHAPALPAGSRVEVLDLEPGAVAI
ncbi:MAG TPA: gephyrin-like molybdotransferase Glp [Geminicoccaceae bacterium]